jgi:hypothetical protein
MKYFVSNLDVSPLMDGGHTGGAALPPLRGLRPPKAEAVRNLVAATEEPR